MALSKWEKEQIAKMKAGRLAAWQKWNRLTAEQKAMTVRERAEKEMDLR